MKYGGAESYTFAPEPFDLDEHSNKPNDCRCSGDTCSSRICTFYPQGKSSTFFPSLLLFDQSPDTKAAKVGRLHLNDIDTLAFHALLIVPHETRIYTKEKGSIQ